MINFYTMTEGQRLQVLSYCGTDEAKSMTQLALVKRLQLHDRRGMPLDPAELSRFLIKHGMRRHKMRRDSKQYRKLNKAAQEKNKSTEQEGTVSTLPTGMYSLLLREVIQADVDAALKVRTLAALVEAAPFLQSIK